MGSNSAFKVWVRPISGPWSCGAGPPHPSNLARWAATPPPNLEEWRVLRTLGKKQKTCFVFNLGDKDGPGEGGRVERQMGVLDWEWIIYWRSESEDDLIALFCLGESDTQMVQNKNKPRVVRIDGHILSQ